MSARRGTPRRAPASAARAARARAAAASRPPPAHGATASPTRRRDLRCRIPGACPPPPATVAAAAATPPAPGGAPASPWRCRARCTGCGCSPRAFAPRARRPAESTLRAVAAPPSRRRRYAPASPRWHRTAIARDDADGAAAGSRRDSRYPWPPRPGAWRRTARWKRCAWSKHLAETRIVLANLAKRASPGRLSWPSALAPETRHVLSPALSLRLPHRGQRRAVRLWRRLRGGAAALSPAATRSRRRRPAGPGHAGRGGHLDLRDDRQRRPRHLSPPARRQPAARLCLAAGRVHRCRRGAWRGAGRPGQRRLHSPGLRRLPRHHHPRLPVASRLPQPRRGRGRWASARRAWAER